MLSFSDQGVVWEWIHLPVSRHGRDAAVAGLGAHTLSLVTGLGDAGSATVALAYVPEAQSLPCWGCPAWLCGQTEELGPQGTQGRTRHDNAGRLFRWFISLRVPLSTGGGGRLKPFSSVPS